MGDVEKPLFPHPPKGFLSGNPRMKQTAEVWGSRREAGANSTSAKLHKAKKLKKKKKKKNQSISTTPPSQTRSSLQRDIFTNCCFWKHFSYQNNPPTFPEDSASGSCTHPRKKRKFFSSWERKLNYSAKRLAGGSWTILQTTPKLPKPPCKCSQADLKTCLSNIFPILTTCSSCQCGKWDLMSMWVRWLWFHSEATWFVLLSHGADLKRAIRGTNTQQV